MSAASRYSCHPYPRLFVQFSVSLNNYLFFVFSWRTRSLPGELVPDRNFLASSGISKSLVPVPELGRRIPSEGNALQVSIRNTTASNLVVWYHRISTLQPIIGNGVSILAYKVYWLSSAEGGFSNHLFISQDWLSPCKGVIIFISNPITNFPSRRVETNRLCKICLALRGTVCVTVCPSGRYIWFWNSKGRKISSKN